MIRVWYPGFAIVEGMAAIVIADAIMLQHVRLQGLQMKRRIKKSEGREWKMGLLPKLA